MTFQRLLIIISTTLIFISCSKKQSDLEFEKAVLHEIFPLLIDSTDIELRLSPPPPPRPIYDEKDSLLGMDTTGMKMLFEEYEKRKSKLNADSVKLFIAVIDSIYPIENIDKRELAKYYKNEKIILDSNDVSTGYKIDIDKLTADKKLRFKYRSEFPEGDEIWVKEYDFHLAGLITMSRIQFDQTKTFGVFQSGFGCGKLCGGGARIFIRKINGKWTIQKIVGTWVS